MKLNELKVFTFKYNKFTGLTIDVLNIDISIKKNYTGSLFRLRIGKNNENKFNLELEILSYTVYFF